MRQLILFFLFFAFLSVSVCQAQRPLPQKLSITKNNRAGCTAPTDVQYLDINNVRALIMNGADMWWDRNTGSPSYEVPYNKQAGGKHSHALFAASLWVGGKDASNGLLKVAAQTYRQYGEAEFWSGPVDQNVSITADECARWDRIWKVEKSDINRFRAIIGNTPDSLLTNEQIAAIPSVIKEWPGAGSQTAKGKGGVALNLGVRNYAPFVDVNKDGIYNYKKGDYPNIKGDQMLWYLVNDIGSTKALSNTLGIGLEIGVSSFAFATNDVLNESTFYEYEIVNRAPTNLDSTYIGFFNCADLGDYTDDYIGCDVERSMAIIYNGDDYDGGKHGYGSDIPMVGFDILGGAKSRVVGSPDITLGMTSFNFFSSGGSLTNSASFMYNFMAGKFWNGGPFVKNCSGFGPGTPYPLIFPNDFRECSPCSNAPGERNFVQSTGPITLYPGAINNISLGVIWVPSVGGGCPSFGKLQEADDYVQSIFDNGFRLPIGPMAPNLTALPYNKKIVFYLSNPFGSNNFNESFGQNDSSSFYKETSIQALKNGSPDSLYKFEGYIVYQLRDQKVKPSEIKKADGSVDETKAKMVFQCDKKNGIKNVINYQRDNSINGFVFQPKLMIAGADQGIKNNFEITKDAFGGTNNELVNYKKYYYIVVAYAYNNFNSFDPASPQTTAQISYRESQLSTGERPLQIYTVMPTPAFNELYSQNQVHYGDGVEVTKLEGIGNAGLNIELTEESEASALEAPYYATYPKYKAGKTPVQIKVTNPDSLKYGDYKVWIIGNGLQADSNKGIIGEKAKWFITRDSYTQIDTIFGERNLTEFNEQLLTKWKGFNADSKLIEDWGFSIGTGQVVRPGDAPNTNTSNGFVDAKITFKNASLPWLTGVKDNNENSLNNWLRPGANEFYHYQIYNIFMGPYAPYADPKYRFGDMINGTWGPYCLANRENQSVSRIGLRYYKSASDYSSNSLSKVNSVDIIMTNDRSKWSRCIVAEMNDGSATTNTQSAAPFSENGAFKYTLRKHPSLLRDPDAKGQPQYDNTEYGRSWFPGYAINQETGERLNIIFGEDSGDSLNNGRDMIWNPTSVDFDYTKGGLVMWGGHHIIYIMHSKYDECSTIYNLLKDVNDDLIMPNSAIPTAKQTAWRDAQWVSPALLHKDFKLLSFADGLIPTETRVQLRVARPYNRRLVLDGLAINNGFPVYEFKLNKLVNASLNSGSNTYQNEMDKLLDQIVVAPNPYNLQSTFSNNLNGKNVRIVNLPQKADIAIYNFSGQLINRFIKDNADSFWEWDLTGNDKKVIGSGMYFFHVRLATELGQKEKVLKWIAMME